MSNHSYASENTSPASPVRFSGVSAHHNNVSNPPSSTEPKEIRPFAPALSNGAISPTDQLSSALGLDLSLRSAGGKGKNIHEYEGSDPTTPRLPSTRKSNNEEEVEETGVLDTLRNPSKSSAASSRDLIKHSYSLPETRALSSSKSINTGNQEPNSILGHKASLILRSAPRGPSGISTHLEHYQRANTTPSTNQASPRPLSPRTQSHDRLDQSMMINQSEQERTHYSGGTDRERAAGGREESVPEKRNRSSSRSSQTRVEKQIQATLAEADSSSHARSRKSSHTFGLFKENDASHDRKKIHDRSRTVSGNSSTVSVSGELENTSEGLNREEREGSRKFLGGGRGLESSGKTKLLSSGHTDKDVLQKGSGSGVQQMPSSDPTSERLAYLVSRFVSEEDVPVETTSDGTKKKIPARLLEEIRSYHNLAAPFHDKFKATQPKSIRQSSPTQGTHAETIEQRARPHNIDGELAKSPQDGEHEEDEPEQISSALYYPHQTHSPDALEDVSIGVARQAKDAQTKSEELLPEPALCADVEGETHAEHVDIELQVHSKNRYLHGDLQKSPPPLTELDKKQVTDSSLSSASESEYESFDEFARPSTSNETTFTDDTGEATPRASPGSRKPSLLPRTRKAHRSPAAPLGAVELKPYNHQVGGHTTVFRFSKRAVCKQLSNRENEFYEVVERQHPDLLKFLPK